MTVVDEFAGLLIEQIKSAIGNSGAFDSSSPDIRFHDRQAPRESDSTTKTHKLSNTQADLPPADVTVAIGAGTPTIAARDVPLANEPRPGTESCGVAKASLDVAAIVNVPPPAGL